MVKSEIGANYGILNTFDEWYAWYTQVSKNIVRTNAFSTDINAMKFLEPFVDGYMQSPVGVYGGKPLEAKLTTLNKINDFIGVFENKNGKKIFLYDVSTTNETLSSTENSLIVRYAEIKFPVV